jgi:hypothetical protein
MTRVKGWYLAIAASEFEAEGVQGQVNMVGMNDMFNENTFDCLDEAYWQEMMADVNYMPQ